MTIAATAAEAFERYQRAFEAQALIQGNWRKEQDGRQLACALGVIGDEVTSPNDCPAAVMPRWLARMVPWFFDRQKAADAYDWGLRFYAELKRIDGQVPFSVVHDWHATVTTEMAIEVAKKLNKDPAPHVAMQNLHKRALAGETISESEWHRVLKPAYAHAYAHAYAYAYADADAHAHADAHAYAYAYADAHADAHAYAHAMKRLADGMVDCLKRVPGR
ncbi:MAG: hypothetical protein AB7G35_21470 [Hyphomicrobiaceae bacterium]